MDSIFTSFLFFVLLYISITSTFAADTLPANQTLRFNQTIVSPGQTFELGFFSPGNSTNHYVGIWFKKISTGTVVWIANRNSPVTGTSGELTLTVNGVLILRDAITDSIVWSSSNSNSSTTSVRNPIARLLDTGNFIISDDNEDDDDDANLNPVWQSFDFLTDTLLPGMKQGRNFDTGVETLYTSWKSDNDPSSGRFATLIYTKGYPQPILTDAGKIIYRVGPWNGVRFSGAPHLRLNPIYSFNFVISKKEIYYQYNLINTSVYTRLVIKPNGNIERLLWIESKKEWSLYLTPERDHCDRYGVCGPYGSCNIDKSPVCECLKGFEPVSPDQWRVGDWSRGCRRTVGLGCEPGEGFNQYSNLKLPDTQDSWYDQSMSIGECEKMCKGNCSCIAYTYTNITSGNGCLLWFGDLLDIRSFTTGGDSIHIRVAASQLDLIENSKSSSDGKNVRIIVPGVIAALLILISIGLIYHYRRKKQKQQVMPGNEFGHDPENRSGEEDLELPLFGLSTLLAATNNFSVKNKLGEGGFGPVYKGVLEDGREIAVKRLAKTSTQGLYEFKNEVVSVSKLQHRNLVKMLGCCIEGAEKMLIYEYLPNKGLDSFIFDETQSKLLDWPARYHIIIGIARGLLYLHQDSRLRIIHRDLKVSNILLDVDMIPKISDFGMARTFCGNQIEANTNRVVGTYGYMAPEYAGDGLFSIKSDVYSFGVLVLEIVCGEKNRGFVHKEHSNNLVGHAWVLHNEGRSLELVAKCLDDTINVAQVLRSIHVALLCVQCHPEDRPTMTSAILMLENDGILPSPKEPGFYIERPRQNTPQYSTSYETSSNNEVSISILHGR